VKIRKLCFEENNHDLNFSGYLISKQAQISYQLGDLFHMFSYVIPISSWNLHSNHLCFTVFWCATLIRPRNIQSIPAKPWRAVSGGAMPTVRLSSQLGGARRWDGGRDLAFAKRWHNGKIHHFEWVNQSGIPFPSISPTKAKNMWPQNVL